MAQLAVLASCLRHLRLISPPSHMERMPHASRACTVGLVGIESLRTFLVRHSCAASLALHCSDAIRHASCTWQRVRTALALLHPGHGVRTALLAGGGGLLLLYSISVDAMGACLDSLPACAWAQRARSLPFRRGRRGQPQTPNGGGPRSVT